MSLGLGLPRKFSVFRPGQEEAVLNLATSDKRFSLLSAPTGSGKSLIYIAISRLLHTRTLVLVGTKGLQRQLYNDFGMIGMTDIRGHSNYRCSAYRPSGFGPRNLLPVPTAEPSWSDVCRYKKEDCLYLDALSDARRSDLVVSNYAYWLSLERTGKPDALGDFDLLVLDEGHSAPDWLARFCAFWLSKDDVKRVLGLDLPSPSDNFITWAREAVDVAEKIYAKSRSEGKSEKSLYLLRGLSRNLSGLIETAGSVEWLIERVASGIKLVPIWARPYAESYLFRGVPRVVLSSATISRSTGKYLGISDSDYHEVDSAFDPERRPFVFITSSPRVRVDHRMTEGQKRVWINRVDSIISGRLDRKGVIHTRSYRRAAEIVERSGHSDIMLTHNSSDTQKTITEFKRSAPPCVLVSPAVEEGYDFPGSDAYYQIIAKVPFVDSRDPITKARSKSDREYPYYLAALSLIQMVGRSMRSADDISEVFILDDHWTWFRDRVEFPRWFRQSWKSIGKVPEALEVG